MASKDNQGTGAFIRSESAFRNFISPDPGASFPAEKGRYALYISPICPWAHRTTIVRILKGLEDIVDLYELHPSMGPKGWYFSGEGSSLPADPLYGFKYLPDLYKKADPSFNGPFTVPMLWDKKSHTVVNNESSEIVRMLTTAFDHLLPEHLREVNRPGGGLYPEYLRSAIDETNSWVYNKINNGVYKTGFATTQQAYEANLYPLFDGLDLVEKILISVPFDENGYPGTQSRKYLLGDTLTEADVRLYTTIIRFDVAYRPVFLCSLKSIRHDYPHIYSWLRRLYWDNGSQDTRGAFHSTSAPFLAVYGQSYATARHKKVFGGQGPLIVPRVRTPLIDQL
ncbi:glutathione S-transferase [Copromyces sp. CBS 386.78]|nr:glutathione S-transferase [Copromyces sp. CBS 386.78]